MRSMLTYVAAAFAKYLFDFAGRMRSMLAYVAEALAKYLFDFAGRMRSMLTYVFYGFNSGRGL